jgi:type I restriction enzyme S subunit
VRLTQLADVGVGRFLDKSRRYLTPETAAQLRCTFLGQGDVLIARLPDPLGRACIFPGLAQPAVTVVDVAIARCQGPSVAPRYLVHLMNSPLAGAQIESLAAGTTRSRISTGNLRTLVVPVPPLAEQHRIVARVDELMGLLDRLEAARATRDVTRVAGRDSALDALREADLLDEVEIAWGRFAERMDDLVCEPADIGPLRRATLELAVRGRLVPQDLADDPASALVERIAAEKAMSVKAGSNRERAPMPLAADLGGPFEIPEGWRWCLLGDLLVDIEGGWSPSALGRPRQGGEWGVLRVSACSWGRFLPDENKALAPGTNPRVHLEVRAGDFLISRANTTELVGRSVVVADCPPKLMLSDKTLRLRPGKGAVVSYLNLANLCESSRAHYGQQASGTSDSMKNVSQAVIRATPIPLPPAAEQRRIVARVDELMDLLDRLEARLTAARTAHAAFAGAAVHHLGA